MAVINLDICGLKIVGRDVYGFKENQHDYDLVLLKNTALVESWAKRMKNTGRDFKNILELGIHSGGGIPYLFDLCNADYIAGIDIAVEDPNIRKVLNRSTLAGKYDLYFETNQADEKAIGKIAEKHFPDGIDMVVDDASHLLHETRRSFEILFPKLRPGGLYIIEDYAWAQNEGFAYLAGDEFRNTPATIQIVLELSMLLTTQKNWVSKLSCDFNTITIERGSAEILEPFFLRENIVNWAGFDLT